MFDIGFSEVHWLRSAQSAKWLLIGKVINREAFPLEITQIQAQFPGSNNTPDSTFTGTTVPAVIQPSGEAMYQIQLPGTTSLAEPMLSASVERADPQPATSVIVQLNEWRELPDGRLQVIGKAENQGDHMLNLHAVHLLLYDANKALVGIAVSDHIVSSLPPHNSTAFSASITGVEPITSWEAFVDANPELLPPEPPLTIIEPLRIESTQRGAYYLLGGVENFGVTPWWVVMDLTYALEGEIIGLDSIELPLPVLPGIRIPFVVDPGRALPADLIAGLPPEQVEVEIILDPWQSIPTLAEWVPLPVQLTEFEQIGDRLYVRGELENPSKKVIADAVVVLELLDLQGRTRTIGWTGAQDEVDSGERIGFSMDLFIAEGLELNLLEFNLWALGRSVAVD